MSLPERREQRARLDRLDRDPDVLMELAKRVADGASEYDVAHDYGVSLHRLMKWLHEPGFPERLQGYEFALKVHGRQVFNEVLPIADNDSPYVQRDRLRVETRLRMLPHWDPQFREAKSGVNIHVGAGGSLIAILAGMDTHNEARREVVLPAAPFPVDGDCFANPALPGADEVGERIDLIAAPQDDETQATNHPPVAEAVPAEAATTESPGERYREEELL